MGKVFEAMIAEIDFWEKTWEGEYKGKKGKLLEKLTNCRAHIKEFLPVLLQKLPEWTEKAKKVEKPTEDIAIIDEDLNKLVCSFLEKVEKIKKIDQPEVHKSAPSFEEMHKTLIVLYKTIKDLPAFDILKLGAQL